MQRILVEFTDAELPVVSEKQCADCKQVKPIGQFYPLRKRGKLASYCAECCSKQSKESHKRRKKKINNPPVAEKVCPDCKVLKTSEHFGIQPIMKDGLSYCCRPCATIRAKQATERNKTSEPVEVPEKRCYKCGTMKPKEEFHINKRSRDHRAALCKECCKGWSLEMLLSREYGITKVDYDEMLKKQNGVCYICHKPETTIHLGKTPRLSVDHCHTTKKVRGLLCYACNHLIGYIERTPKEVLERAFEYLK